MADAQAKIPSIIQAAIGDVKDNGAGNSSDWSPDSIRNRSGTVSMRPKSGRPTLKQPTFRGSAAEKYL